VDFTPEYTSSVKKPSSQMEVNPEEISNNSILKDLVSGNLRALPSFDAFMEMDDDHQRAWICEFNIII